MDNVKNTPRDTFLYLLAVITLVASAVSFGILVYQLIDIRFPDVLQQAYLSLSSYYDSIRSALAALIVVFPVFVWVSWFLRKDVVAHPEKKDLKIRRWLLYLTVFIAALVIIGDLVALIYNFLQGELTMSFVLKVITIFFIAGSSLFYYLAELRDLKYPRMMFQNVIVAIIALAVGFGFYTAGSPQNQRLVRFDDQKVNDLQTIQDRLVYYWQQKVALPLALAQLNDPISGFSTPVDAQSGQSYEYHMTGVKSFQLCAVFNKANDNSSSTTARAPGYAYNNWQHGEGRVCFDRTIDQALYPPNMPKPVPVQPQINN